MVLELGLVLLETQVDVLELVHVLLEVSDPLLGLVEVVLVPPLHSLNIAGSLDNVGFEILDLALKLVVGVSDLGEVSQDGVSLVLDALEKLDGALADLESLPEDIEFVLEVGVVDPLVADLGG